MVREGTLKVNMGRMKTFEKCLAEQKKQNPSYKKIVVSPLVVQVTTAIIQIVLLLDVSKSDECVF